MNPRRLLASAALLLLIVGCSTPSARPSTPEPRAPEKEPAPKMGIQIKLTSIFVEDQAKALDFYTSIVGFEKKTEIALPNGDRWLTVVAAEGPDDLELLLEPNSHAAAKAFQAAIYEDGIPATTFPVGDLKAEHERLKGLGVVFRMEPTEVPGAILAVFDDTCGNFIQLHQVVEK